MGKNNDETNRWMPFNEALYWGKLKGISDPEPEQSKCPESDIPRIVQMRWKRDAGINSAICGIFEKSSMSLTDGPPDYILDHQVFKNGLWMAKMK